MACYCVFLKQIVRKCCFLVKLRLGVLLIGCIAFTWFIYLTFGTAFMMESIFPNEYQLGYTWPMCALKTTTVFSFFGIFAAGLVCIGVHRNNEMLFLPFLFLAPIWILVHILALTMYAFKAIVIFLLAMTMFFLAYAWIIVWSYYCELIFAYDDDVDPTYA